MKMGKLYLLILGLCFTQMISAKEVENPRVVSQKGKYETNRFFNNFFIGGSGGVNMYIGADDHVMGINKRLAPAIDLYVGKWFTPWIGGRISYSGQYANGWSLCTPYMGNGEMVDGYYKEEFSAMYFHADFMWNISNAIGGYKPTRFWNFIPYLGTGYIRTKSRVNSNAGDEIAASVGLYNALRVSRLIDITIDLRQLVMSPRGVDPRDNSTFNYMSTATVGIAFKIGNKDFKRASRVDVSYYDGQIRDLKEACNIAQERSYQMMGELAAGKEKIRHIMDSLRTANVVAREVAVATVPVPAPVPVALFFEVGKPDLGAKEIVNLTFYVENAIRVNPKRVFTITGIVDNSSGKKENNKALAEKRVQYVYDLLIKEYGIKPQQLVKGGVVSDHLFPDSRLNRVVIIK